MNASLDSAAALGRAVILRARERAAHQRRRTMFVSPDVKLRAANLRTGEIVEGPHDDVMQRFVTYWTSVGDDVTVGELHSNGGQS